MAVQAHLSSGSALQLHSCEAVQCCAAPLLRGCLAAIAASRQYTSQPPLRLDILPARALLLCAIYNRPPLVPR